MRGIAILTESEKSIVRDCIAFILDSGRFDLEGDCETLIGITEQELRDVFARWPLLSDWEINGKDFLAVNNCLNEVCHGSDSPSKELWSKHFSSPLDEMVRIYRKWANSVGLGHTGIH